MSWFLDNAAVNTGQDSFTILASEDTRMESNGTGVESSCSKLTRAHFHDVYLQGKAPLLMLLLKSCLNSSQ